MTACSSTCATPTSPSDTLDDAVDVADRRRPSDADGHAPATRTDLGRLFFIAEFAVAVAGWALEINPFDQPNVQEAKDNTSKVLDSGSLPTDRRRPTTRR